MYEIREIFISYNIHRFSYKIRGLSASIPPFAPQLVPLCGEVR